MVLMILAFPLFHFTDNPHCDPKPHAMLGEHSWLYYAISCQKMLTSSLVMESSEIDLTACVACLAIPYIFCKHMTCNSSNISYGEILDCCKVLTPNSALLRALVGLWVILLERNLWKNWFLCCQPPGPTALWRPQRDACVLVTPVCCFSVTLLLRV